jgi:hypothetical protein
MTDRDPDGAQRFANFYELDKFESLDDPPGRTRRQPNQSTQSLRGMTLGIFRTNR